MSTRRRRSLTPDELALWSHVTRHVSRLPGQDAPDPPPAPAPEPVRTEPPAPPKAAPAKTPPGPILSAPPPKKPAVPPLAPLERRLRQRLSRGNHPIDAVIDLHGRRQSEAHEVLRGFLHQSQSAGYTVVLVVTGKGGQAAAGLGSEERGVLRRTVPHWLRLPDMRAIVVGFEEAAPHHGGSGALYVRLRRRGRMGAP
jgi:DNA-nicking Smr family endonuclease